MVAIEGCCAAEISGHALAIEKTVRSDVLTAFRTYIAAESRTSTIITCLLVVCLRKWHLMPCTVREVWTVEQLSIVCMC